MIEGVDTPTSAADAGAERDTRPPKPCARRLGYGHGWCLLADGHEGGPDACVGRISVDDPQAPDFGPRKP